MAVYDAETLPAGYGRGPGLLEPPDVVLLKSRTPEARQVARTAERAGSLVVNSPAATEAALDRAATAEALDRAGVPAPRTWSVPALRELAADGARRSRGRSSSRAAPAPVATSCAWSAARTELAELLPEWAEEPVIAQEFAANDGFDIKVWVIGTDLSAARRRSAPWSRSTRAPTSSWTRPTSPRTGPGRRGTPEPPWACSCTASTC